MAYLALARKYRPQTFDDFVGQEPIARTLKNAMAADKVSHAYLFCGARGIGKTSMARVFAMALNCAKGPTAEPCGQCESCRDIQASVDLDVQELDGASNNGVDQVRALRENARFSPNRSRYRIYYIDEAHMLTTAAFNALLKTLEEPPDHVKFILSTTAPGKMPDTIHSRCQRFDFRRISAFDVAKRLRDICEKEGLEAPDEVLLKVGRLARGSMRDGLSLFDQLIAFCGGELTEENVENALGGVSEENLDALMEALRKGDAPEAMRRVHDLLDTGTDESDLLEEMAGYARLLLLANQCGPQTELLERPAATAEQLVERAKQFTPEFLMYAVQTFFEARNKTRLDLDGRVVLEIALVKLARSHEAAGLEQLLARLESLEARLSGAPAQNPSPSSAPSARQNPSSPAGATPSGGDAARASLARETSPQSYSAPASVDESNLLPQLSSALRKNGSSWASATLLNSSLVSLDNASVTIAVSNDWTKGQLLGEYRRPVEEALEQAAGKPLKFKVVVGDGAASAEPKEIDDEGVREATEIFEGRVIDRRKSHNG